MNLLVKLYLLIIISLTGSIMQASFLKPVAIVKAAVATAVALKFVHDHSREFFQTHKQIEAITLRLDQIQGVTDRTKEHETLCSQLQRLEQARASHYTKSLGFLWYPSMEDAIKKRNESLYS